MTFNGLDTVAISKILSQNIEQVTCIECCKYYIDPKTAICGHTLCHVCWRRRRTCPICTAPLQQKALKFNIPKQKLTEHVQVLVEAFEKMFKIKLEEFLFDVPETIQLEKDPTKHVKDWLACSDNHFSAQPLSSQPSIEDLINPIELSASNVQVHVKTKKNESPARMIVAPHCQKNWDKIETLPDTEEICKNKENVIGPMDIEPFSIDDNEYTTVHPRRSTRNKDLKHISQAQSCDISTHRQSAKNSSTEVDIKPIQNKQNWSNVKRMKKEFSKLNKQNRNKLNVSIEMCKKAQSTVGKSVTPTLVAVEKQVGYVIEDNTPDIMYIEKEQINDKKPQDSHDNGNTTADLNVDNNKTCPVEPNQVPNNTEISIQSQNVEERQNVNLLSDQNMENDINMNNLNRIEVLADNLPNSNSKSVINNPEIKALPIPFLKKGDLYLKNNENDCIKVTQNVVNSNVPSNTDDIEIAIKIGNTVTNIVIKNKQKDVQFKVNTDCEVQTSLGPYGLNNKKDVSCSPFLGPNMTNIELNACNTPKTVPEGKSTSAKKNTASDDTSSAYFEITESIEKELSTVMDSLATDNTNTKYNKQATHSTKTPKNLASSLVQKVNITESVKEKQKVIDDLNDCDIFDSNSVKEVDVQLLKSTKWTPSETLQPTLKNKKSQKVSEKRARDVIDQSEMPSNKKHKMDSNKVIEDDEVVPNSSSSPNVNKDVANDSENMNYNPIISQAFANIVADMRTTKHVNIPENIQNDNLTPNENNIPRKQIIQIQTNRSTQSKLMPDDKISSNERNITELEEDVNEKYSENVFSILEKECELQDEKNIKLLLPDCGSTQQHIENLLTPGLCRDLVSSQHDNSQQHNNSQQHMDVGEISQELGTPVVEHDDSDKSIVEETPQKNLSFSKLKLNHDGSNKISNNQNVQKPNTNEDKSTEDIENRPQSDSQIIKSVINLCDTSQESDKGKDITVVGNPDRNEVRGTPVTINKFFNHIQYKSTPMARKSLNFDSECFEDPERTLCPTNTQEKEFLAKAFERMPNSQPKRPLGLKNLRNRHVKFCIAGSCLTPLQSSYVKKLCYLHGWTFVDKFTKDLTHLVVVINEERRAQRTVKYMCALAASKWIVSFDWVEQCLQMKEAVDELPYEVLDVNGDPGPRNSRVAKQKLFEGMTFYSMPPFSVLDVDTLKIMLEAAGGRVVDDIQGVRVAPGAGPALVLAEPEHTQENRFLYLAMTNNIVPVNYEWAVNSLGSYKLCSIHEHLLYPTALLPKCTAQWPVALMDMTDDSAV